MINKGEIIVQFPPWKKIMNEKFIPIIGDDSDILILYGGRGAGKSKAVAIKLIFQCLTLPHFRCLMVRNTANTIQNSCWKNIQDTVNELGLQNIFEFIQSPLSIRCYNGNTFIAAGCDDPGKIKSVAEVSHLWIEEDIIKEDDYIVISSSIRTRKVKTQVIISINPEVTETNYQENWLYKRFFSKRPNEKDFKDTVNVKLGDKEIDLKYTIHFSTYKDNRFLTDNYKALLEDYKNTNPYRYQIYTLGEWGNKESGDLFYPSFNRAKHCENVKYNPERALHITLDFNNHPGNACSVWQIDGKNLVCLESFFAKSDIGNTKELANILKTKYHTHESGMYIYGDASSKHEDTRSEKGWNDYKLIEKELREKFHPKFRIPSKNPPIELRGQYINEIFAHNIDDINITIDFNSSALISDLENCKMDADRCKNKSTIKVNGITYQQWGHQLDAAEYLIIELFSKQFSAYQKGKKYGENNEPNYWTESRDEMSY